MAKGIVYILTNPSLDGWIKIGMSIRNDINKRLAELNRPVNIPLSYRAHAIYEVENPEEVEKQIHNLFDQIDESLHARETLASGRIRQREFFHISPEKAFSVFKSVAKLRGDEKSLKLIAPSDEQIEEEEIAEQTARRPGFKFSMLNIPVGSELRFIYDEDIICISKDRKRTVEYQGKEYSLSGLASYLLFTKHEWKKGTSVAGPRYFTYQGKTLSEMRNAKERGELEE